MKEDIIIVSSYEKSDCCKRKPIIALLFSLSAPGLGQVYNAIYSVSSAATSIPGLFTQNLRWI